MRFLFELINWIFKATLDSGEKLFSGFIELFQPLGRLLIGCDTPRHTLGYGIWDTIWSTLFETNYDTLSTLGDYLVDSPGRLSPTARLNGILNGLPLLQCRGRPGDRLFDQLVRSVTFNYIVKWFDSNHLLIWAYLCLLVPTWVKCQTNRRTEPIRFGEILLKSTLARHSRETLWQDTLQAPFQSNATTFFWQAGYLFKTSEASV